MGQADQGDWQDELEKKMDIGDLGSDPVQITAGI